MENWCTRDSGTPNSDGATGTFCFLFFLPANLELQLAHMAPLLLLLLPLWITTSSHLVEHVVPLLEMRFHPRWRDGLSLWHKQEAAAAHKSSCRGVAMPKLPGPNIARPKNILSAALRGRRQTLSVFEILLRMELMIQSIPQALFLEMRITWHFLFTATSKASLLVILIMK